ncbi:pentapeptide repeat-containing protein [Methylopila sp. Yamaguchi]|uniref:pentapeptide repeat-containing protein n=1 Tax=Methylopila sp. Yamaguchi TaxID=1437817 RepID=UPI001357CBB7|nr:pentapeptide repeat-containing protein [Methylopila sp. Yamaguchi]
MSDTTAELLARYARGERSFQETDTEDPEVLGLDEAILAGADFSRSFLVGSFRRADLRGASFHKANVKTCDFSYADLSHADFRGAAIDATIFQGANLFGARFAGASSQGHEMADGEFPDQ